MYGTYLFHFVRCQQKQAWLAIFGSEMCVTVVNEKLLSNNSCYRVARPEVSAYLKSIWRRPFQRYIVCCYRITLSLLRGDQRFYRERLSKSSRSKPRCTHSSWCPWNLTARLHRRLHSLIASDERVYMTARLCASTTTHAANVRYCKFSKNALVGRTGPGISLS